MSAWDETVWALSRCDTEGCEEEGTEEYGPVYLCPACYVARATREINELTIYQREHHGR